VKANVQSCIGDAVQREHVTRDIQAIVRVSADKVEFKTLLAQRIQQTKPNCSAVLITHCPFGE
jgi:hypothetical protein